jgi:hypothetical protein
VTFAPKIDVSFKKKPIKPKKNHFEVGFFKRVFLGFIGRVFLGRFFIANPGLKCGDWRIGRIGVRSANPLTLEDFYWLLL